MDRIQFYRIRTGHGLKNFTVRSSLQGTRCENHEKDICSTSAAQCSTVVTRASTWVMAGGIEGQVSNIVGQMS